MERRRLVRVPASSANLGPGYDVFAAALGLHMELEVVETGAFAVETDLPIATDARNLAVRGFAALADPAPFTFRIRSEIPLAGGFGTSAAAFVAGLLAADHLFELDADVAALANALEGHPDNVAAALHGGFVVATEGTVARFDPPTGLEAVAVVPREAVRTKQARAAMPAEVPVADAVFNVAHASLLVLGLARGDWDLVARGLDDRLHQPRRGAPVPAVDGPRPRGARARRARGDDLRRGPVGARLVSLRADGRRLRRPAPRHRGLGERRARALRDPGRGRARAVAGARADAARAAVGCAACRSALSLRRAPCWPRRPSSSSASAT